MDPWQATGIEAKALTVSALTAGIRSAIEPGFRSVWVKGEVSNFRGVASSGHLYFSLKDADSVVAIAAFGVTRNSGLSRAASLLKEGTEVLVHGRVTLYPPRGSYQLTVDQIELLGVGALQAEFERLKRRLGEEGLFSPERKRKLPPLVHHVAIITSSEAAAFQDFLRTLDLRAPWIKVTLVPSLVQGQQAPAQLMAGLAKIAVLPNLPDLVVLARGGGSMEDLWAFNDERLARAIAACPLPVVSAVGHEVDFTIADFVADVRAATPTAAAEILSTPWVGLPDHVDECLSRLLRSIRRKLAEANLTFEKVSQRLVAPADRVRMQMQRVDELHNRLVLGMAARLERKQAAARLACARLEDLSPLKVLTRGYVLVQEEGSEKVIRSCLQVKRGQRLRLRFNDGVRVVQAD